jgi:hypothetical protein
MPVIGYLSVGSPGTSGSRLAALRQGLGETGFVEGQSVAIEYRWAEGRYKRLPAFAADLVSRKVDLIAAFGPPPAFAAKSATIQGTTPFASIAEKKRALLQRGRPRAAPLPCCGQIAPKCRPRRCAHHAGEGCGFSWNP